MLKKYIPGGYGLGWKMSYEDESYIRMNLYSLDPGCLDATLDYIETNVQRMVSGDRKMRFGSILAGINIKVKEAGVGYDDSRLPQLTEKEYEIVESYKKKGMLASITFSNIIPMVVYYTIRKVIKTSWLNNKDSYLYPNDKWHEDIEFQNNCLMFDLFTNSNNVQTKFGKNHWIPFTEKEVNSKGNFESNFMSQVINGTITQQKEIENILFENKELKKKMNQPLLFSDEAKAVFESGLNLWKYYHSKEFININASFYDIKEYFQGRNEEGRMNSKSNDEKYTELIGILKTNLKILSKKITPKVFDFEFLK